MLFQRKVTITDKKLKKILNPVKRYFDLMDSLKMYPIRGGGGADPIIVFYMKLMKKSRHWV